MSPAESKELKDQVGRLKETVLNDFLYLEDALRSMQDSQLSASNKTPLLIGDRIRVFAACADMEGASIEGLEGEVVSVPDPSNIFAKAITVRILEVFGGQEFSVYPEQCQKERH